MHKKIAITIVLIIAFLILLIAVGPANPTITNTQNRDPTSWPMFQGNPSHTGNSKSIAPKTNQTLWTCNVSDVFYSSPAIANGIVYIGSQHGCLYALNTTTGSQLWNYSIEGNNDPISTPAIADGIVYIDAANAKVYALNANTGKEVWNYTLGNSTVIAPTIAEGVVYVVSNDHKVYALNASTGEKIWTFETGWYIQASPAVSKGIVYVESMDPYVYALNATTGKEIWRFDNNLGGSSSPAVYNDVVYVGSFDHNIYALNAETGKKLWNYTTGQAVRTSPAIANGKVYAGSEDGGIYALNAETGEKLWNYTVGGYGLSSPAVAGGVVYIGAVGTLSGYGCNFYALNAATGIKIWSVNYPFDYSSVSSAGIANGVVYVGFLRGNTLSSIDTFFAFGSSKPNAPYVTVSSSTVDQGASSTLSANMNGSENFYSYQWFSEAPNNLNYSSIQGATSSNYTFVTSTSTYPGVWSFKLQVTNGSGVAMNSSETLITVNNALTAPNVFTYATNLDQSQSFSLSSAPLWTGAFPYSYQWLQKAPDSGAFTNISNANKAICPFTAGLAPGTWNFILQVTDSTGAAVNSTSIAVTINAPSPTPTTPPTNTPDPTTQPNQSTTSPQSTQSSTTNDTQSPSQTPTVPELSITVVILLLTSTLLIGVFKRSKQKRLAERL